MTSFPTPHGSGGSVDLDGRLDSIVAWLTELEERVRTAELLKGDDKTAKELRKAVEAVAKHDPKLEERLGNRVDVLADRFATLATTVSTTTSALAGKDGEIAALRRELDDRIGRVEATASAPALGSAVPSEEVAELRKALDAVSAQKLPKNIEGRIDDLKASLGVLTQRLDTLSSTVSTTAAGLAGREGEVVALRRQVEESRNDVRAELAGVRAAIDPAPVAELRESLKRVAADTAVLKRDDQRRFDATKASFEQLSARVEAAISALAQTTSKVASSDQVVTALQARYDEESARVDSLLVKLHQTTSELSGRVAELDGVPSAATVEKLAADLGSVARRVDELAGTVADTATGYAAKEYEIAALSRRFEEISAQVDAGVQELRTSVESIVERGVDPELERRVDVFAARVTALEAGIAESASSAATGNAEVAGAISALEARLTESASAAATKAEVEGAISALQARLVEIAGTTATGKVEVEGAISALQARLVEVANRLESQATDSSLEDRVERLDSALGGLAAELAKLGGALNTRAAEAAGAFGKLESRLEELAAIVPAPGSASRLEGRLDELAARISTLDEAGSAGRLAASGELSGLDGRLAELEAHLAEAVADRSAAEASTADQLAALVDERASLLSTTQALEERVADLGSGLDRSAAALEVLETELAGRDERTGERETELRALSERFQESSARVDGLVAELQGALESMPAPPSAGAVEEQLSAVETRLEQLEETRGAAALEIARAAASWAEERSAIREELGTLASAATELREERSQTGDRIDTLVASLAELESRPAPAASPDDRRLEELAERLQHAEDERERLATELSGATAFWSSGLGAMEARVSEIASGKRGVDRKVDDEVVSALFDLARRLDAVERASSEADAEVIRTAESWAAERHSLAAGLDELMQRLDSLGGAADREPSATSVPDDDSNEGRARLELRALELRMEHAEAAARENRDAVLVQLERLASRIEWRLHRLETGKDDEPLPEAADGPLAQVVSIHGGDA